MEVNHSVILGFGSNLGNSIQIINDAYLALENIGCTILEKSSFYESAPWGFESEHNFINSCILLQTKLDASELLLKLKTIENQLGRTSKSISETYSDRTIDIDILFFDNLVIENDQLVIPHPRLAERNFVLFPLQEIAQNYIHPKLKLTVDQLLYNTKDKNAIRLVRL